VCHNSSDFEVSYTILGRIVLIDSIKKPVELMLYRLFLWPSLHRNFSKFFLFLVSGWFLVLYPALPAYSFETISLKNYKTQAIKTDNPVNLTRLPLNKTFQVNSPDFVLQFFFSGPDVLGIIFKRNLDKALFVRWCFFRNCEESPFDYVSVIAQPHGPPLVSGFFEIRFPPGLNYHFQGLYFYTRN
jgi:hypothetical protein